jgi:ATP-dependent Clp endopeptidase proteolytic subunit ClpP
MQEFMTRCNTSSQTLLQFVQEWQLLWSGVVVCAPGKRSALPHSRVMIHQPSGGAQGVATDMEINLREMLKLKDELYKIISEHSGQTFDKVHKDSERDYWMIAEEAKNTE